MRAAPSKAESAAQVIQLLVVGTAGLVTGQMIARIPLLWSLAILGVVVAAILIVRLPAVYLGIHVAGGVPVVLTMGGFRETAGWSVLMVLAVGVLVFRSRTNTEGWVTLPMVSQYLFTAFLAMSLVWAPAGGGYSNEKIREFVGWVFLPFIGATACALSGYVRHFMYSLFTTYLVIAWSAFPTAREVVGDIARYGIERVTTDLYDPIMVGRIAGLAFLFAVVMSGYSKNIYGRVGHLLLAAPAGFVLVASETRGAVIGVMAGILALCVRKQGKQAFLRTMVGVVICGGVLAWGARIGELERISLLSDPKLLLSSSSIMTRIDLYRQAALVFPISAVIGVGLGGGASYLSCAYPHNIIMEIAVELGMVGLALFLGMVIPALWRCARLLRRGEPDPIVDVCVASFMFAIVGSLISYDMQRNWLVWVLGGILLAKNCFDKRL